MMTTRKSWMLSRRVTSPIRTRCVQHFSLLLALRFLSVVTDLFLWLTAQVLPKEKEKEKEKDKKKKKKSKKSFSSPLPDVQSPDPGLRLKVTMFTYIRLSVVRDVGSL